jgi:alkanesulfonate monooxygenase SsuD/methylene tetrahydromethanopterin reductase-like flavin-dependent oxidoreductase (luciferase family)
VKFGFIVTTGDPGTAAALAAEAEAAGWDGVFTFDAIAIGEQELFDPWVVLSAIAMRTTRVRIGAILTPPARRRPWKLARETMSVDRLSGGRLVLPVGLGALDDAGFGNVGEPTDARTRAELLDESLEILEGLWSGEPFAFDGRHYHFGPMTQRPTPIQRPRIPIWVAAAWPRERSMRRAIRYDGLLPQVLDEQGRQGELTPTILAEIAAYARRERNAAGLRAEFDLVAEGTTPADRGLAGDVVRPWAEAGATWWVEADWVAASIESMRGRIAAGPPRVDP